MHSDCTAAERRRIAEGGVKQLPQFLGSSDPTQNNGIGTDAGQSVLNMRGLGENRTLVLLDGRRFPPEVATGFVDVWAGTMVLGAACAVVAAIALVLLHGRRP